MDRPMIDVMKSIRRVHRPNLSPDVAANPASRKRQRRRVLADYHAGAVRRLDGDNGKATRVGENILPAITNEVRLVRQ
jgi:hypothetical protein